jgi:hypothetical protein
VSEPTNDNKTERMKNSRQAKQPEPPKTEHPPMLNSLGYFRLSIKRLKAMTEAVFNVIDSDEVISNLHVAFTKAKDMSKATEEELLKDKRYQYDFEQEDLND